MMNKDTSSLEDDKQQLLKIYQRLDKNKKISPAQNQKTELLDEAKERLKYDGKVIQVFTETMKEERNLKKNYAISLIVTFILQLLLFNIVFILYGLEILTFSQTTINLYLTGGILEVVALMKIIINHLFKDSLTEPLKSVLEKK